MIALGTTERQRSTIVAQRDLASAKINLQNSIAQEIQSEQSVDPRCWRKCVSQHGQINALLSQGGQFLQFHERREFDSAPGRDLNSIRLQRRVVPDGHQMSDVDQRSSGTSIQSHADQAPPRRPVNPYRDKDQTALGLKGLVHTTTAVFSGISPV